MILIGIVANKKCFETIKSEILKKEKEINILHINPTSIDNMKNIKFETIIIQNELEKMENHKEKLKKMCKEASYVLINTDINSSLNINENFSTNKNYEKNISKNVDLNANINLNDKEKRTTTLITYGINQNAIVTISSNSDENILIYWQKSIENKAGKIIDIEERRIKKENSHNIKIDEILIIYTIFRLYEQAIIEKI